MPLTRRRLANAIPVATSRQVNFYFDIQFIFSDSFSCVELVVQFRGGASHGWLSFLLPCILLVFASWFHFWVHPSWSVPRPLSAAVPFLLFICFLVCLVFRNAFNLLTINFQLLLPIESCALRIWLIICTFFTLFSLIEYFLVIRCYSTIRSTHLTTLQRQHRPPSAQQNYEDGKETTTVVVTQDEVGEHSFLIFTIFQMQPLITSTEGTQMHKRSNRLDLVSRIAFPIAFLITVVVFVLFYTF